MTKFQVFWGEVKHKHEDSIQNELEKLVSHNAFLYWKNGVFEPAANWWSKINEIAERYGYAKPFTL